MNDEAGSSRDRRCRTSRHGVATRWRRPGRAIDREAAPACPGSPLRDDLVLAALH